MGHDGGSLFVEALVLLGGAIVAASLFKRLGLGTVLGYLALGVVVGPVARLLTSGPEILDFAGLGVVFLLFVIGLELKPARLWSMKLAIFGLGLLQVIATGLALAALAYVAVGLSWQAAAIAGFGLALSSTAFAMQILEERGETGQKYAQTAFAVLLFQDLAIVPLLALVPVLSPIPPQGGPGPLVEGAVAAASIAALFIAGRYLINPFFRVIANTGAREVMIAAALFVVLGSAMLMQIAGLSMAMGAFLAGLLLAESTYRHELEADIEPFRGILLGLFFVGVGMSLNLSVIAAQWLVIVLSVPVLMAVKAAIIYGLCRLFGTGHNDAVRAAFLLPQGGEFGFVLFSAAASSALMSSSQASLMIAIVTVSMALTPISIGLGRLFLSREKPEQMEEDFDGAGADVLMIGFSRFGQIASQVLLAGGRDVTIIDISADRVRAVARFGFRIYFGDGSRKDVLEAAGIRRARIVAVCTARKEMTDRIVALVQSEYPDTKLFVRSYDRGHSLALRASGVHYELRETVESGLVFGRETLAELGMDQEQAELIMADMRRRDEDRLAVQAVEGIAAGRDMLLTKPTPEPLVPPRRESKRLDRAELDPEPALPSES
jgi:monovalent cation:H+ antiporter-2, CPA2 family